MDYTKVAEAIDRQAKTYQSVIDAAAALKEIGSLENAAKDYRKAADAALADLDAAKEEVKKVKAEQAKAKEKADAIVSKANDQALEVLREAEQKGQAMADAAAARAAEILSRAEQDAAMQRAGIAGQVAQLTSTKVAIEQDVATLQGVKDSLKLEAEDLEKRLSKAKAQLEKLGLAFG